MTVTEAKRGIYRKCRNCRWWMCGVWVDGEPDGDNWMCSAHMGVWRDGDEDACKSFDYAKWAIKKAIKESEEAK